MTTIEKVSENLKAARKQMGYTQQQVADHLKIHLSQWQKYEYAKLQLDYDKIIQVCKYLDISPNDLFNF